MAMMEDALDRCFPGCYSMLANNVNSEGDFTFVAGYDIGGKTGTTNAAGHCLMLLSRDTAGSPYISVILRSSANDVLYPEMVDLLDEINK